ncbi:MAG: hypothetical protein M0D57_11650 [Sphingobacteriales bacterium JAD_PAG50586_3]|nr:MAG: hypothetical protein M0D57_11650 [Sphingobacteriales bacterium JAD_PAG50586_3]
MELRLRSGAGDNVTINNTHDITLAAAGAVADNLTVNSGGTLTLNDAAATLTVGPACGGNRNYINNGSLTISAGTLTVGGNVQMTGSNANFTMSGGSLVIDGNDGTSTGSVAENTPMLRIGSINTLTVTAGTITIVDPHFATPSGANGTYLNRAGTAFYYSGSSDSWAGNTFVLGGTSCTNTSTATNGFIIDASLITFGNFTVNGGTGARVVAPTNNTSSTDITIGGNLLINSGCTLQTFEGTYPSSSIYVVGNVTNNGTLNITSGRDFGLAPNNYWYSTGNAAAQTVSGTGTFTLAGDFYINNEATATPNVTFSVPITIGGDLFMYHGKNSIGTNNFTVTGNVDNQSNAFGTTNMFIANSTGRFQRVIPISPSSFDTYLFPIGENTGTLEYSPASLNFSANTTSAKTVGLNVTDALHPNHDSPIAGGAARISRYWSIATTPTTGTYTYTGYCQYLTADVTAPEASIEMQNWDGSAWTTVPGGAIDDINNRLEFGSTTTSAIFPLTSAIIAGRQSPPPANDACLGAITIACNDSKSGSTNSATDDGSLVNCGGTGFNFKGVWYVMTAPSVSQVTLSLCTGTSFDSYIRVYSGTSCASLTCVTSNDQYCGNQSQVSFNANGTSNYYILVSGYYASEFGSYTLTSTCVPIPLNNDCPGTNIVVDAAAISGTTIGANQTVNDNYGPGYDDDDVWYTFTAPATGNAIITLTENPSSPTFDGVLELRTTAACPATRIQARDFTIGGGSTERMRVSGLTPSAVYRLRVFSYGSTGTYKGPFTIGVATGYTAPANDNVCNAITATVGTVTCNTNTNYGFQIGEPTGSNWDFDVDLHTSVPSNTQWYAFTPTAAGSYTISASMGSGIQMGIYTATANSCANILIAANRTEIFSDYTFGGTVTASAQCLTAGTTYYIQLNGDMGSTGTPSLTITNNNPAAPVVNAITTFDCNSFTATWPAVTNATGYRVDVATNPGFSPMLVTDFNNGTSTSYAGGGLTPGQIYYVRVRTEGACSFTSANSSSQSITLTPLPGTVVATAGTNATTTSIDANWGAAANATSYVLEVSTVSNFASTVFNSNVGNVTTYTVNTPPLTPGTPYYYRVTAVNACGNAAVSNTITYATLPLVGGSLTWTGASSTDWNTPGNWTPAGPPTVNDDILIPNQTNDPVLTTGANGVCKSVTINSGATVTINTGKTIDVKGNWTGANNVVSGPGDLIFSGTTAQTISGGAVISNLQINNTSGVTAAAGVNTVNVTTALELKEGVFTTNGNVIIVSSAGTPLTAVQAYINDFTTGMNGSLSGTVRVERYITAGPNGFRYIGAPVNRNDLTNNTFPVSSLTGFVLSGTPDQLIPSADCSPLNSAPNSPYGNFMYWVENSNYGSPLCRQRGWWFQTSGNMQLGRGYGAKLGSGNKLTYTGFANNGSITHNCTHTVVFGNLQNGWNLVSNPFPSAITINSTSADASNPNNNMPAGFDGDIKFLKPVDRLQVPSNRKMPVLRRLI